MTHAPDAEIIALLEEFHDASGELRWSRPISRAGGVRELSRAFGAFGKTEPERAVQLAALLSAGRHERAAGALVREMASEAAIDSSTVLALLLDLDARGFASPDWREDAASALQQIAQRDAGLADPVVTLLEGWIENDPVRTAAQIADRLAFEARNPRGQGTADEPQPVLFGSRGGIDILPNDNFTILSAIAAGLLRRDVPHYEGWASVLERHLERSEDPGIWTAILAWRGEHLLGADAARVTALLDKLWEHHPAAFMDVRIVRLLWRLRGRVSDTVMIAIMVRWMGGSEEVLQQAAAEFLTAAHIVDADSLRYRLLFGRLNRSVEAIETGILFSAAAGWRERDPTLRRPAHAILMAAIGTATGPTAHALSRAVDSGPEMLPDEQTGEILAQLPLFPEVLQACLNHHFVDALQGLLLHPGFDAAILAVVERITSLTTSGQIHSRGLMGEELVHVAIALQRSDGPLRGRAMDVYESLLDAGTYGAEQAAKDSLER